MQQIDKENSNCSRSIARAPVTDDMLIEMPREVASNENKMSDGWRESAWLGVEDGISSKVRNQSCQPFAPSHG